MKTIIAIFLALGAIQTPLAAQTAKSEPSGPEQPVPFNHKKHLANGLACKDCHTNPDPGDEMVIPAADKCMVCHATVKKDSPAIQKLAEYYKNKEAIPWKRVYTLPNFVFFSHKTHLDSGKASCADCHGEVRDLEVMRKVKTTNMAFCVDCHRTKNAPNTCTSCHDEQ
jgi:hypothetical protein